MMPHPLANFGIQKYYENESRFNGIYSRDNLSNRIKDIRYWFALFCLRNEVIYFGSFDAEHIPEEIKQFIGNRNISANIFRVQANNSIMCGYFCIGFIDFMLAGKTLIDYTALFSPYDFNKNNQIILSYFKDA